MLKLSTAFHILNLLLFSDEIRNILVEIPWGARTDMPSYFNVTVLVDENRSKFLEDKSVHFAWQFENKVWKFVSHI